MLKKLIIAILRLTTKLLNRLGVTLQEVLAEVVKIMMDELNDLENMTIAELRNLAKTQGISLEGKRVKGEIIEVIKKHLGE